MGNQYMSSQSLSIADYNNLQKNLNFNTHNIDQLEFFAALQAAFTVKPQDLPQISRNHTLDRKYTEAEPK